MKKRNWICLVAVCFLLMGMLAGCGAKSEYNGTNDAGYAPEVAYRDALYDSADSVVSESIAHNKADPGSHTGSGGVQNQKLIRTMHVEAETDDLDALLTSLDGQIRELNGYVENRSIRNGSKSAYRTASLTIRIPVDRLDDFILHVQGVTNIISQRETADDITLSYVATASRITALETEQQRLLELLAKAENMSDLLMIEQRLTDVRTELEEVTSQLRLYDNLVDYGTVNLSVTQVQEYTVVEEQSIWQRMGSGLAENWKGLCEFAENLLVLIVVSLPYLIPVGLAALLVFLIVRLASRPRKKDAQQPPQAQG